VNITKKKFFLILGAVLFLAGVFAVSAGHTILSSPNSIPWHQVGRLVCSFNSDGDPIACDALDSSGEGNPDGVIDSANTALSVNWNSISNRPVGLDDGDDIGAPICTGPNQIRVTPTSGGTQCLTLPNCVGSDKALQYDGFGFSCTTISGGAAAAAAPLKWKQVCAPSGVSSPTNSCPVKNCVSPTYGSYYVVKKSNSHYVCDSTSTSTCDANFFSVCTITATALCSQDGDCSSEGSWCYKATLTGLETPGCCGASTVTSGNVFLCTST